MDLVLFMINRIIYAIGGTTPVDFLKIVELKYDEDLKTNF